MFFLFKTPPINSSSSSYELLGESHNQQRIENLYQAYLDLGNYDMLLLTVAQLLPKAEDASEEVTVQGIRDDTPLVDTSLNPDTSRHRKSKKF